MNWNTTDMLCCLCTGFHVIVKKQGNVLFLNCLFHIPDWAWVAWDAPGHKRSPAGGTSEPSTGAWRGPGAPTSARSASGSATLTLSRASASEHPAPRTTNDSLPPLNLRG